MPRCHCSASSSALATLLSHPAIWRGDDVAPEPAAVPSGYRRARRRVARPRLAAGRADRASARARRHRRDPPHAARARAPAGAAARRRVDRAAAQALRAGARRGGPRSRRGLYIVACRTPQEALWAFEQALRAPECGAAFAWLATHDERVLRRLQVAARDGRTWGALWRRPGQRGSASAAPLRLALVAAGGQARRARVEAPRR